MSTVTDAQDHLLDFFASSASFESSDTFESAAASSGEESSRSMTSDIKSFLGSLWYLHAFSIALSNSILTLSPSAAEVNTSSILFFVANLNFFRVIFLLRSILFATH